jgi:type VI secretion system protein VasD
MQPTKLAIAALALGAAALASCATPKPPPPPPPTLLNAELVAGADVNPDRSGRPSPVMVKLYELKSIAAFQSADFFSLFERDKEALGAELVDREELAMVPGSRRQLSREAKPDTRYFAVVAAFRDLERAHWRAAVPIAPNQTTVVTVRLESRSVSIAPK